jgi:glycosyltransferase involved in cell wall biosynthesis
MNEQPLVSVIIPVYNTEKYVGEAIESILNQTYKNLEILILDDASTDRTPEIVEEYAKKDLRIKVFHNEKNLNIAGNRNKGVNLSRGKYIIWQDADDISAPTRVEKQVKLMEENPEVGICGGYIHSFNEHGLMDTRMYDESDGPLRNNIFKFSPVAQPSAIVRKECFDTLGNYNLSLPAAEDLDFSFRVGTKYKFANVQEVVILYREHQSSNTYSKLRNQINKTLEVRNHYSSGYNYKMTLTDRLAYYATWLVSFLPAEISIPLFKTARSFVLKAQTCCSDQRYHLVNRDLLRRFLKDL